MAILRTTKSQFVVCDRQRLSAAKAAVTEASLSSNSLIVIMGAGGGARLQQGHCPKSTESIPPHDLDLADGGEGVKVQAMHDFLRQAHSQAPGGQDHRMVGNTKVCNCKVAPVSGCKFEIRCALDFVCTHEMHTC